MQLSKYFTLEDLTTTNTGRDNTPDTFAEGKLRQLAVMLDLLYDQIGPFRVNSAYRSPDVNDAVKGSETSLHLRGIAADLAPLDTSAEEYFKQIIRSGMANSLGEIINESDRGVVHVTLPYDGKTNQIKYAANGTYYRYTPAQLDAFLSDETVNEEESIFDAPADTVDMPTFSTSQLLILVVALAGIGIFALNQIRKEA